MSNRCKALVLSSILAACCLPLVAQTYTLQPFSIPFAPNREAFALGINNRGAVVGYFDKLGGGAPIRGFKRDANGVFERPLDDPNSGSSTHSPVTRATAINDYGVVAGSYINFNSNTTDVGFLLYKGVYTDFSVQPGSYTQILGINNKGDFVGGSASGGGFVYSNGGVSQVNCPNSFGTVPYGIAADGTIVGGCVAVYYKWFGFMRGPAGQYKTFRIHSKYTVAYGINNVAHKIVGAYGRGHGFVYDYVTGAVTTVDWPDPNTRQTVITGINSQGIIVGWVQIKDPQFGLLPVFSFIGTPQ